MKHINARDKTAFVFKECLEARIRDRPQPEALYADVATSASLVIEHKNLVWPLDHAKHHSTDHEIADRIAEQIGDLLSAAPHELRLRFRMRGTKNDLIALADSIAQKIRANWASIARGGLVGSRADGREWSFRIQSPNERDCFEPSGGLATIWDVPTIFGLYQRPDLAKGIQEQLQKVFVACQRKFADYSSSRRYLLLDVVGDVTLLPADWDRLFQSHPPPNEIQEIWFGSQEWITDIDLEWQFARLYPGPAEKTW